MLTLLITVTLAARTLGPCFEALDGPLAQSFPASKITWGSNVDLFWLGDGADCSPNYPCSTLYADPRVLASPNSTQESQALNLLINPNYGIARKTSIKLVRLYRDPVPQTYFRSLLSLLTNLTRQTVRKTKIVHLNPFHPPSHEFFSSLNDLAIKHDFVLVTTRSWQSKNIAWYEFLTGTEVMNGVLFWRPPAQIDHLRPGVYDQIIQTGAISAPLNYSFIGGRGPNDNNFRIIESGALDPPDVYGVGQLVLNGTEVYSELLASVQTVGALMAYLADIDNSYLVLSKIKDILLSDFVGTVNSPSLVVPILRVPCRTMALEAVCDYLTPSLELSNETNPLALTTDLLLSQAGLTSPVITFYYKPDPWTDGICIPVNCPTGLRAEMYYEYSPNVKELDVNVLNVNPNSNTVTLYPVMSFGPQKERRGFSSFRYPLQSYLHLNRLVSDSRADVVYRIRCLK